MLLSGCVADVRSSSIEQALDWEKTGHNRLHTEEAQACRRAFYAIDQGASDAEVLASFSSGLQEVTRSHVAEFLHATLLYPDQPRGALGRKYCDASAVGFFSSGSNVMDLGGEGGTFLPLTGHADTMFLALHDGDIVPEPPDRSTLTEFLWIRTTADGESIEDNAFTRHIYDHDLRDTLPGTPLAAGVTYVGARKQTFVPGDLVELDKDMSLFPIWSCGGCYAPPSTTPGVP